MHESANAGAETSRLYGLGFERNNRTAATQDGELWGRWVATDESGWDGEQLYGRTDRYLVIGSVAIDDAAAAAIVEHLRHSASLAQPPELKFGHFAGRRSNDRVKVLKDLLKPNGPLADRAKIYIVDKHYFATGKIIDLLLEEHAYARGINLHAGGIARDLARTLFNEGARALGLDGFNRLVSTIVNFASMRNRDGLQVTVDELFDEIERAWARSYRRQVTGILNHLRGTRREAENHLRALRGSDWVPTMEPLIPCLTSLIGRWSAEIGGVSVLTDEQRVFTDDVMDRARKVASWEMGPLGRFVQVPATRTVRSVVRGVSQDHPSIQLADLIAGAGQAVARRHTGVASPAGEELWPVVIPLITDNGMLSHDEPSRFATAGPLSS
ncbi:DUF3800 domain-containing protein [Nonomuraea sp. NPDC002799]